MLHKPNPISFLYLFICTILHFLQRILLVVTYKNDLCSKNDTIRMTFCISNFDRNRNRLLLQWLNGLSQSRTTHDRDVLTITVVKPLHFCHVRSSEVHLSLSRFGPQLGTHRHWIVCAMIVAKIEELLHLMLNVSYKVTNACV